MQVKKFEAPTIQEALENVKRELGPEAVILQTKKNKRGFGLMSKASVEVTAAISDRSLQKKQLVETRVTDPSKSAIKNLPAERQAEIYDKYMDKHLSKATQTQDRVEVNQRNSRITATRYIDIDDDVPTKVKSSTTYEPAPQLPAKPKLPPQPTATAGSSLEDEVRSLKRMIEELKITQEKHAESNSDRRGTNAFQNTVLESPLLQDAFEQLVISGVDRRYAHSLIKKVAFEMGSSPASNAEQVLDLLAVEIMEAVKIDSPLGNIPKERNMAGATPVLIALIGPTGVGKTTTLAKLASEAVLKRGLKVGLINLDNYKLTAFDQLGTYARILKLPFRSAASIDDLKAALLDFHGFDLVMIDTTGRSQRDPDSLKEMHEILRSVPELCTYIVLSATTRDSDLYEAASRFSFFRPQGMIISKLDEATVYGGIYNVSQKVDVPLLYFTTGQKIPDDIEQATKERVAALILDL
jgi:flagellar biosynthesis protein FlhF